MILNVQKFKTLLRKATVGYSIDNVSFTITKDRIKSQMSTRMKDVISILNLENDIVLDVKDELILKFYEPNTQLLPFLNLVDEEETILTFKEDKIKFSSGSFTSTIHFCEDEALTIFGATSPKIKDYFFTIKLDDELKENLSKIKKIGSRFGKVYFSVNDNKFYIESMDKCNKLSNGLSLELAKCEIGDRQLIFDYKNLFHIISILDEEKIYFMNFAYLEEREMGMLYVKDELTTEQYILMSRKEDE